MRNWECKFVRESSEWRPGGMGPAVLLAIWAACGSVETRGDPERPGPDAGAAADAPAAADAAVAADAGSTEDVEVGRVTEIAAAAICDALFRCCDAGDRADYFAAYRGNELLAEFHAQLPPDSDLDHAACPGLVEEMLDATPFGDWVTHALAGRVTFLPQRFGACIDTLQSAQCGSEVRAALYDSTCLGFAAPSGGDEQRSFFARTSGSGATCAPIRDGVGSGFFGNCDPTSHFCCYVNEDTPEIGCAYPFLGDGTPRAGSCAQASAAGEPCSAVPPIQLCATGLSCDFDTLECVASSDTPLAVGDTCVDDNWNMLGDCVDSWCDLLGSSKCEPLKEDGAACSAGYECLAGACAEGHCTEPTMCVEPDDNEDPDAASSTTRTASTWSTPWRRARTRP